MNRKERVRTRRASPVCRDEGGVAAHDSQGGNMTLKTIAIVFGIVLVAAGLLGFVPALNPGGKMLGIFDVNAAHNVVHLATGVIALVAGFASDKASKIFFQVFGIVYAAVAALGFYYGEALLLGVVSNNVADTWLHVVIAVIALYLGFMMQPSEARTASVAQ
jgi:hypothetical protein